MSRVKDKVHYVSNRKLYEAYVAWHEQLAKDAAEGKEPSTDIPPFIVESMMKICRGLSYKINFIGYSYKEDMISDALYDCIRYAKRFNIQKSNNPFSYITTIAIQAFRRRIDKEKTESYTKALLISEMPLHEFYDHLDHDDEEMVSVFAEMMGENANNMTNNMPQSLKKKLLKVETHKEVEGGLGEFL